MSHFSRRCESLDGTSITLPSPAHRRHGQPASGARPMRSAAISERDALRSTPLSIWSACTAGIPVMTKVLRIQPVRFSIKVRYGPHRFGRSAPNSNRVFSSSRCRAGVARAIRLRLVYGGTAAGLGAAMASERVVRTMLYGVAATDIFSFATAAALYFWSRSPPV